MRRDGRWSRACGVGAREHGRSEEVNKEVRMLKWAMQHAAGALVAPWQWRCVAVTRAAASMADVPAGMLLACPRSPKTLRVRCTE